MTSLEKRMERQRALVTELERRLLFELLVLERLEGRANIDDGPLPTTTLASILRNARRRSSTRGR